MRCIGPDIKVVDSTKEIKCMTDTCVLIQKMLKWYIINPEAYKIRVYIIGQAFSGVMRIGFVIYT